jgi:hypothetical protein
MLYSPQSSFTWLYWRLKVAKLLPAIGLNAQYFNVLLNKHVMITRKGVTIAANQPPCVAQARIELEIPAGAESYDAANVRVLILVIVGVFNQLSAGIGDTTTSNIL